VCVCGVFCVCLCVCSVCVCVWCGVCVRCVCVCVCVCCDQVNVTPMLRTFLSLMLNFKNYFVWDVIMIMIPLNAVKYVIMNCL